MANEPRLIRRDKATREERPVGSFYVGTVTGVRNDNRVVVRIPALQMTVGPVMPINSTTSNRMAKGDQVLCAFTDYTNSTLAVFGTLNVKTDQYAPFQSGITTYPTIGDRDADIQSPEEGRVVYVADTDELQIYNGTSWITVIDTGSSENISAETLVATSASIGTLTVTGASTLNVLGASNLSASTTIGTITPTELGYLDGVTSGIQAQINSKSPSASPTFTGTVTAPVLSVSSSASIPTLNISVSASAASLSVSGSTSLSGSTSIGNVSSTEISYLDGVTSAIQTQLNGKLSTAVTSLSGTTDQVSVSSSTGSVTLSLPSTIRLSDGVHVGGTGLTDVGSVSSSNWFRSTGQTGWYSHTYGGGIWMQDTTWVRVYNGKNFYCPAELRSNSFSGDGTAVYGSYGSISIRGTKNGWAGFDNTDTSSAFMWNNTVAGHYRNNNQWTYNFQNGSLFMQDNSYYVISYVNNNNGLPWCYGPYMQGYNGWAYANGRTGTWQMGYRDAYNYSDGLRYIWVDGRMIIGRTPDDAHAFNAHLMVDGSAAKSSGGTTWGTYSDIRSKTNIQNYTKGLNEIIQLRPVSFTYNGNGSTTAGTSAVGLIAQEVEEVMPDCVRMVETFVDDEPVDDFRMLEFNDIQFAMINAIKELNERLSRIENG